MFSQTIKNSAISFIVFFLLLFTNSCDLASGKKGGSSSGADATAGGFLNGGMFIPNDGIEEISKEQAANSIKKLNFIYLNASSGGSGNDNFGLTADDECQIKKEDMSLGGDGSLVIRFELDDSDCQEVEEKTKYVNKMRIFINIGCSDTDLESYLEKQARDFVYTSGAREFCPDDALQTTLINAEYERASETEKAVAIGGMMTSSGQACVGELKDDVFSLGECGYYQKTTKTVPDEDDKDITTISKFVTLTTSSLSGPNDGAYYADGQFEMQVNNWTGPMKNSANNVAPTYEIGNGDVVVTGSFKAGLQ